MRIKKLSNDIEDQILILFWQFTIRTLEELDIVSNQNLSIEMFLIRLMHLNSAKPKKDNAKNEYLNNEDQTKSIENKDLISNFQNDTIPHVMPIDKIISVKNVRAWVSRQTYLNITDTQTGLYCTVPLDFKNLFAVKL